jgi:predicted small integral membrane protein
MLLLVALLLPWYGRDTDIAGAVISETWTAWQTLPVITVLLFAIAALAIAVPGVRVLGTVPATFRGDRLLVALGLTGLALVLFRLVDMPIPAIDLVEGDRVDSSRGPGLFLALLATACIAYGGRRAGGADPR